MAKLKVFSAMTFIGEQVRDKLGERRHIRQGSVLVVAANKAAAIEEIEARLRHHATRGALRAPALRDPDFRLAIGDDVDALRAAGLLNAPTVLVTSSVRHDAVVALTHEGVRRVGTLRRVDGRSVFVPAGPIGADPLREFAEWVASIGDEPPGPEEYPATLDEVITRAREALGRTEG